MMRSLGIGTAAVFTVLLFGCLLVMFVLGFGGGTLIPIASSPEELTQQLYECRDGSTRSPQVLAMRKWEHGVVILHKAPCPPREGNPDLPDRKLNYSLVKRGLLTRVVEGGGGTQGQAKYVECGQGGYGDTFPPLVYGRVKQPRAVVGVEVATGGGRRLLDDAADGFFALVAPEGQDLHELRVLGRDGEVLERIDLRSFARGVHCF